MEIEIQKYMYISTYCTLTIDLKGHNYNDKLQEECNFGHDKNHEICRYQSSEILSDTCNMYVGTYYNTSTMFIFNGNPQMHDYSQQWEVIKYSFRKLQCTSRICKFYDFYPLKNGYYSCIFQSQLLLFHQSAILFYWLT